MAFRFQLDEEAFANLRSQFVTLKETSDLRGQNGTPSGHGGRRYLPFVFTEQGIAMLSAVLRSETAVAISIQIMQAFVAMRHFVQENALLFREIKELKTEQVQLRLETDRKFE